jgi:hypothetical protein
MAAKTQPVHQENRDHGRDRRHHKSYAKLPFSHHHLSLTEPLFTMQLIFGMILAQLTIMNQVAVTFSPKK